MPNRNVDVRSAQLRALPLLHQGRHAEALQICTDALARGADDPVLRLIAAHSLLAQQRIDAAESAASHALRLDPMEAEAHRILADVAASRDQTDVACEHLKRVIELDPDDENSEAVLNALGHGAVPAPAASLERFLAQMEGPEHRPDAAAAGLGHEALAAMMRNDLSENHEPAGSFAAPVHAAPPRGSGRSQAQPTGPDSARSSVGQDTGWVAGRHATTATGRPKAFAKTLHLAAIDPAAAESAEEEPTRLHRGRAVLDPRRRSGSDRGAFAGGTSGVAQGQPRAPAPMPAPAKRGGDSSKDSAGDSDLHVTERGLMDMLAGAEPASVASSSLGSGSFRAPARHSASTGEQASWDPLAEAQVDVVDPLDVSDASALYGVPRIRRAQLTSSRVVTVLRKAGQLRVALLLAAAFVSAALGVYGYLAYRKHRFLQAEWAELRAGVHADTLAGMRAARAAAARVVARYDRDQKALAAVAMCDVMLSTDFGEDRLDRARTALKRTSSVDSEWRTAAEGRLSLLDDPPTAAGYLKKGVELFPHSAILLYLRGRALAAMDMRSASADTFRAALKLAPDYLTTRISLARVIGASDDGFDAALELLDAVIASNPSHVRALLARARLRISHGKQLTQAADDAQRVAEQLRSAAGPGSIGWAQLLLAQIARQQNRVPQMSAALDQAIASPACCDAEFRNELATELQALFRLHEAYEQMKAALKISPKRPSYVQRMAQILLSLHRTKEAAHYLALAPARLPRTLLLAGRLAFMQGAYKKATVALTDAARERSTALEAQVYLALVQARRGDSENAAKALQRLIAANPHHELPAQALGRIWLWQDEYARAEAALKQAWRINRLDPLTPTLLGYISMAKSDPLRAAKRFERALQSRPDYAAARVGLAELLRRGQKIADARTQAAKIPVDDRNGAAYRALEARLAIADQRFEQAASAIAAARAAGAQPPLVARLKGELDLARGRAAAAVQQLEKAEHAYRKDSEFLVVFGRALLQVRRLDDANDTLQDALDLDPDHPAALQALGEIATHDGETKLAIHRLEKSIASMRQRDWPRSTQAQVFTTLGESYLKDGDTGRALTSLQDAIDLDPRAAEPYYRMGLTYDRLDRPRRAVGQYRKAIELDSSLGDAYLRISRAYEQLGDSASAAKYLAACIANLPGSAAARTARKRAAKVAR